MPNPKCGTLPHCSPPSHCSPPFSLQLMNNQIQSYSFPLAQGCNNSFIAALKSKHFLIAASLSPSERPASLLHSFKYEQQTPKKSFNVSSRINGSAYGLISGEESGREITLGLLGGDGSYRVGLISASKIGTEQDPISTLYEQEGKIEGLHFKKDLNGVFLWQSSTISLFDIQKQAKSSYVSSEAPITSLSVDPIHEYLTYVTEAKTIHVCDKRSNTEKFVISCCNKTNDRMLGMDYNPNKQCYLMTCHHQSLKFWDIRRGNLPVRCYDDHHNLLTSAAYNPSHDELIACAYDDGTVGLLRLHSVCSSPQSDVQDTLVRLYDEHEDSVFSVAWSAFSPWVFASVTYNASNLVVNIVPSVEKYRILL